MSAPSRFKTLLGPKCDGLRTLVTQAGAGEKLAEVVRRNLPAPDNAHVVGMNIAEKRAVLCIDSPVWATRMRYHTPQILQLLRTHGGLEEGAQLHIKVVPQEQIFPHAPPPRQLSQYAAQVLRACAENIDDPQLQRALRQLAARADDEL